MFQQLVSIARKLLIGEKEQLPYEFELGRNDSKELRAQEDHYKQPKTLEYFRYKDYIRHGTIKNERP